MKSILQSAIAILLAWQASATTLTVLPGSSATENAGNSASVDFTAKGVIAGQLAYVWLVNSVEDNLVVIDIPMTEGFNHVQFTIPFSWSDPGRFYVQIRSGAARATSPYNFRIRSAIIYPYGGTLVWNGLASCVKWSTESFINADFLQLSLVNESLGERYILADDIDPEAGVFFWIAPAGVAGSNFRLVLEGYFDMVDEYGYPFEDWSESTTSEVIRIQ